MDEHVEANRRHWAEASTAATGSPISTCRWSCRCGPSDHA